MRRSSETPPLYFAACRDALCLASFFVMTEVKNLAVAEEAGR